MVRAWASFAPHHDRLSLTLPHLSTQPYVQFGGVCFETQHYPDSINQPHFPTIVLKPGEVMTSTTEFRFK